MPGGIARDAIVLLLPRTKICSTIRNTSNNSLREGSLAPPHPLPPQDLLNSIYISNQALGRYHKIWWMEHTLHWLNDQQNGISMLSFIMSAQWLKALKILSYSYLKKNPTF